MAKTSTQRANFPEFTDKEFRGYKEGLSTLVWEGEITLQDFNDILDKKTSLFKVLDEKMSLEEAIAEGEDLV